MHTYHVRISRPNGAWSDHEVEAETVEAARLTARAEHIASFPELGEDFILYGTGLAAS
jgi:hypothetical protein